MAFTYDLTTDLGEIRFRIGDTVDLTVERESLTDAEINSILASYDDLAQAAVVACMRLMAVLRHKVARSVSNVNSSQNQKLEALTALLADLKAEAAESADIVAADAGTSQDYLDAIHDDSDFIDESFSIGMHDKEESY